ncbi:MAG TPA: hypothetical protein VK648_00015 [Gemmatimonadaceae bacterium]|nr:hypothetical protein [Gemmatimonadaceae bacterium]
MGDKLVLIVDQERQLPVTSRETQWIDTLEARAGYYDFSNGTAKENGHLSELAAPVGGYSHE